jgi:hypothetical protein
MYLSVRQCPDITLTPDCRNNVLYIQDILAKPLCDRILLHGFFVCFYDQKQMFNIDCHFLFFLLAFSAMILFYHLGLLYSYIYQVKTENIFVLPQMFPRSSDSTYAAEALCDLRDRDAWLYILKIARLIDA